MFRRRQNQFATNLPSSRFCPRCVWSVWTNPPPPGRKRYRKKDGAKHWTARTDDVPGDGSTAGWNATTGQLPATFVPSAAAAAAVQFTSTTADPTAAAAAATTKSIPAFSA